GPGVAERWEQAADGKSWTFYLRKGSASTTAPRADRPRRAGLRARRIDPRPDHEPPQGSSGAAGAQLSPGGAQPGHRALHRSSHRGHVPRPHRGARRNRTALPKPAPSIHESALLGGATGRPGRTAEDMILSGEVPSPIDPPSGYHFNPRCPL